MIEVATLYVRNVPPELYAEVKGWASASGRSLNAEVLAVLEHEAERRRERTEWLEGFLELRERLKLTREEADEAIAAIRAHRDAGI
jgi:plasmid stability protein